MYLSLDKNWVRISHVYDVSGDKCVNVMGWENKTIIRIFLLRGRMLSLYNLEAEHTLSLYKIEAVVTY